MDKVRKNIQGLRNMVITRPIFISYLMIILLLGVFVVPRIYAQLQPTKSVEIFSEKLNYNKKEPGSWKVTKSAKWLSKGVAEISFDVDTIKKTETKYIDILLVLDVSGSMEGSKLSKVKSDTKELVKDVLSDSNNRIGLITFDTGSQIVTSFTNDKDDLTKKINNLDVIGNTNYYQALINVETILKDYSVDEDRKCVVLFLTDGYPNEETPNEVGQYNYLKSQYPFITINGIQYEMGDSVVAQVKQVTDNQFVANMNNLNNILFEAAVPSIEYNKFEITDYIDTDNFLVENDSNISVSRGNFSFDKDNQKISWNLNDFKSGSKANMKIELKIKNDLVDTGDFYSTNTKEEIRSSIDNVKENVSSTKTPIISNEYKVKYIGNAPNGCEIDGIPAEKEHLIFDTIEISDSLPTCGNYQFKEWKITTSDVEKINDDYFIMPEKDVEIVAIWSKLGINKSMNGSVQEKTTLYRKIKEDYDNSNHVLKYNGRRDTYTGDNDIYYYEEENSNNNVLFGGFCWKIYRTTDAGGVKIIYNGLPSEDGKCNSIILETSSLTAEQIGSTYYATTGFNNYDSSVAYFGFMYNIAYPAYLQMMTPYYSFYERSSMRESESYNYYYADDFSYIDSSSYKRYTLKNPTIHIWGENNEALVGKYTCKSISTFESCYNLYYILSVTDYSIIYIRLNDGETLSTIGKEPTMTFSDSISKNDDGTYTMTNPVVINKKDWSSVYNSYKHFYTCLNNETTCQNMKYVIDYEYFYGGLFYSDAIEPYKFGNSFVYDNGVYKLVDTVGIQDWEEGYNSLNNYHYTCFNSSGTCDDGKIYYVYGSEKNRGSPSYWTAYYIELSDGKRVEDALQEMLRSNDVNKESSNMKSVLEYWFQNNLLSYVSYLEDTPWCNDRNITNLGGWNPNGGVLTDRLTFTSDEFSTNLICPNSIDRFTVNKEHGNGALTYPVGLVTDQEINLSSRTLKYGKDYWHMSPCYFDGRDARFTLYAKSVYASYDAYIRPSVSLKPNIAYIRGDGSIDDPYIIEANGVDFKINVDENSNVTANLERAAAGRPVKITSNSDNYIIESFKMNGELINGDTFIMPNEDAYISDVSFK